MQSTCNYVTLFLRNTANVLAQHVSEGGFLRFVQIAIDDLPGRESEPSQKLFTGGFTTNIGPGSTPTPTRTPPRPGRPGVLGRQRGLRDARAVGNPPGNVGTATEKTTRSLK